MNTWYSVDLGDGIAAYKPTEQIQEAFTAAYVLNRGATKGMAAFSRYDTERNIVTVYFTPPAHQIAKVFNATPCEKPSIENLGLLIGDQVETWRSYFPGEVPSRKRM
jgi:hypothetical protein